MKIVKRIIIGVLITLAIMALIAGMWPSTILLSFIAFLIIKSMKKAAREEAAERIHRNLDDIERDMWNAEKARRNI